MDTIQTLDFWYFITHLIFIVVAATYFRLIYRTGILYNLKSALGSTQVVINGVKNNNFYDEVKVEHAKGSITTITLENFCLFCFCVLLPALIFDFTASDLISLITTLTILIIFGYVLLIQGVIFLTMLVLWMVKKIAKDKKTPPT